eukprot:2893085-Pleurochrysis_carterae.AAC.1
MHSHDLNSKCKASAFLRFCGATLVALISCTTTPTRLTTPILRSGCHLSDDRASGSLIACTGGFTTT